MAEWILGGETSTSRAVNAVSADRTVNIVTRHHVRGVLEASKHVNNHSGPYKQALCAIDVACTAKHGLPPGGTISLLHWVTDLCT